MPVACFSVPELLGNRRTERGGRNAARVLGVFVNLDRGFVGGKDQILVIFSTF